MIENIYRGREREREREREKRERSQGRAPPTNSLHQQYTTDSGPTIYIATSLSHVFMSSATNFPWCKFWIGLHFANSSHFKTNLYNQYVFGNRIIKMNSVPWQKFRIEIHSKPIRNFLNHSGICIRTKQFHSDLIQKTL